MEGVMAEQKRKETRPTKPSEGGGDGAVGSPELAKKGKKIKEDIDKLLDEIDDILEENAEEFVKSYVQRGGE
jgi:prokaryotic ubiquitin-like protein Pup